MSDPVLDFEISGGNVFADLGLQDPEERLMKAQVSRQIAAVIQQQRLTQAQAAEVLGVSQPKVSAILNGRLGGFSVERLIVLLLRLGKDVQLVVKAKPRSRPFGTFSVTASTRGRAKSTALVASPRTNGAKSGRSRKTTANP